MNKILVIFVFVSIAALLSSCGGGPPGETDDSDSTAVADSTEGKESTDGHTSASAPVNSDELSVIPVEVTTLSAGDISNYLLFSANLETEQSVQVYARIGGLVEEILVDEGSSVKKDQPLLQLDKDVYELAEREAYFTYQKQQANYDRMKALQEEELLSEQEFEDARLTMEQAMISWRRAELNLKYTTVTSPIEGVVGDREVNIGDLISTTQPVFSLANLNQKIVKVYVPQNDFNNCFIGQKAILVSDVAEGSEFYGKVKRISPLIDPLSGTFKVTIEVNDARNELRPGMFVTAQLVIDTHHNTRLIPKAALVYEGDRSFFFIVAEDSCQRIELDKGYEDAVKVESLNDIELGSQIVVLGQSGLKEGSKVKVTSEKEYAWQ